MKQMLGTQLTWEIYRLKLFEASLKEHGVKWYWINGRLWILEISTYSGSNFRVNLDEWIDATDWNKNELWAWLGY